MNEMVCSVLTNMKTFSGLTKYSFHPLKLKDENASLTLQSKPGERVRIFFVDANINNPVAFHPIAGIWDKVYINSNPKNTLHSFKLTT